MRTLMLAAAAASCAAAVAVVDAAGATPRTERFSLIHASADGRPVFSAIATGAFTAAGTAAETKRPTRVIIIRFPAGTITLTAAGMDHARQHKLQTTTTCLQTRHVSGNYTIAGGTGAYARISGSGTVTHDETFVEAASGGQCARTFLAIQAIVVASGPVSLP